MSSGLSEAEDYEPDRQRIIEAAVKELPMTLAVEMNKWTRLRWKGRAATGECVNCVGWRKRKRNPPIKRGRCVRLPPIQKIT